MSFVLISKGSNLIFRMQNTNNRLPSAVMWPMNYTDIFICNSGWWPHHVCFNSDLVLHLFRFSFLSCAGMTNRDQSKIVSPSLCNCTYQSCMHLQALCKLNYAAYHLDGFQSLFSWQQTHGDLAVCTTLMTVGICEKYCSTDDLLYQLLARWIRI